MNPSNHSEVRPVAVVFLKGREYLHPYLHRVFDEAGYRLDILSPGAEVPPEAIVCARIAGADEPCAEDGLPVIVVPEIVGTGMQGVVRELAEDVAAGRFFAIRDFDYPRIRVVHATDVAAAALQAAVKRRPGVWSLDDGERPTLNALADALAFRMKGKRLYALPRKWAMLFGVGRRWRRYEQGADVHPSFAEAFGFAPTPVCEYLRTHVYDENSL